LIEVKFGGIYLYEPPKQSSSEQAALLVQSGSEQEGMRPYVVVSRDAVHKGKSTCVGVALTSRTHKANSYRIFLPSAELIHEVGCTPFQNSVALCDHIRVLDINQIKRKIGRLSANAMPAIGAGLAYIFDLR
jgi:mRNA-degrading endonuclease toxin of MazEF toxin-antitoxin module